MKTLILLMLSVSCCAQCPKDDTTAIKQEVFFSELLGKYALVTTNGSLYDSVVHGSLEYIEAQKPAEFQAALRRRKAVKLVDIRCL